MNPEGLALLKSYQAALRRYVKQGTVSSLQSAGRLGRRAMALGMETLDLARIHEDALLSVMEALAAHESPPRDRIPKRAGTFFAEALLPIEAKHRTALETSRRLTALNQALARRTQDLSVSNRKLKSEITKRKAAEESLRKSEQHSVRLLEESRLLQEKLQLLSRRVLWAQEEEHRRISRDLHDVVAQMLTGINFRLATLKTEAASNTKGLSRKISHAQRLVEKSVAVVHRFAGELRPPALDDLGLIPALHSLLKGFTEDTGVLAEFSAFAEVETLSIAKRTVLYRVAQEALSNIARHAQAARVNVTIRRLPRTVLMRIKDDGKGFEADRMWRGRQSGHLGMLGMRERVEMIGGKLEVESAPGQGTAIQVQIPVRNHGLKPARP